MSDNPTQIADRGDAAEVLLGRRGAVATITLNRPDALNAITATMLESLGDLLEGLVEDPGVRIVVLTGSGRAFSAGVDLKALGGRELVDGMVGDILDIPGRRVTSLLSGPGLVTVAKVNGFCFTGALELAMACDVVVAAEEAKLADTHAKFGIRPTWGMSQRLPRLVGIAAARELSYTARTITGAEARQLGLAARAAPLEDLDAAVDSLIEELLANSDDSMQAYKDLYRQALDGGLDAGLAYEAATNYPIADTNERIAGFR
jgi:enoyl-CoA hydratase/carnithine racemase